MGDIDIVRLSVPGTLAYRDVVVRVVASVCRVSRSRAAAAQAEQAGGEAPRVRSEDFDDKIVSAVGEAFNNIALHAYERVSGDAVMEVTVERERLVVRLEDTGASFDPAVELGRARETLRESRMGIDIMLACMDEVTYSRGTATRPNVLTMSKRYFAKAASDDAG